MALSGRQLDEAARQKAADEASGVKRMTLSPAALKRLKKAKRARELAARKAAKP